MPFASEFLLEIDAHDGAGVRTARLSSSGFTTNPTDNPANAIYQEGIVDPGTFRRSLFAGSSTLGQSEAGYGEIVLANADGALDWLVGAGLDGRAAVLKRLDGRRSAYASAETIMRATLTGGDNGSAWTELRLRLYDRLRELDKPLQANRYAGTTTAAGSTADGSPDLKDRIKPLVFGRVFNIELVPVNPFNLLYQASDGPCAAITCYDGGVLLTNAGDYPTIEALINASIRGGTVGTCLSLGLVRFGGAFNGKPAYAFTADVVEGATAASRSAAAIAQRILARMGITGVANLVVPSFAALQALAPQEVGIYVGDESTALSVLSEILGSIGGWIVPNALGQFEVGRITAPGGTPAWSFSMRDVMSESGIGLQVNPDTDGGLPAFRTVVRHSRVWRTHAESEIAPCAASRGAFLAVDYREAKAENAAVLGKHLLAPELVIDTLLTNAADAAAEAARRLALYSVRRDVISFPVRRDDAAVAVLGSTGTLTLPRFGYGAGRPMLVIGREEDPANERVTLTLWG
ncbi:MAG: hypothetical protein K0R85_255 [Devosia sp.]|jgi:hypothetical protein|nr:hypothetical protein [Devosia sp.]